MDEDYYDYYDYRDDYFDDDYFDDDYPCDSCSWKDECDVWEAQACSILNVYLGIDDYDPHDV